MLDHHSSRCRLRHLVASECAQRHIGDHVLEGRVLDAAAASGEVVRSSVCGACACAGPGRRASIGWSALLLTRGVAREVVSPWY